ncbi:MAG: hypothetical protein NW202_11975 [Nitrospira sp.]|nr:hypothetical protein [Nitrospira sp.]
MTIIVNKLGRLLLAGAFLFTSSGCSLINPHVTWETPKLQKNGDKIGEETLANGKKQDLFEQHSSLAEGIMYADNAMKAYKGAIADQSRLSNILPLLLIPLGAAGLAMGIDGANATAIAALGLTGAATLGVGNFWSSKPRQLIYAAGERALICAKTAVLPLDLAYKTQRSLEDNVKSLREKLGNISPAGLGEDDQNDIAKGRDVLTRGEKLLSEISRGNSRLINTVDDIDIKVTEALTTTIADPKAIQTTIGGLAAISTQFTAIPDSSRPKGGTGSNFLKEEGNTALIAEIRKSASEVSAIVSQVATANLSEDLKKCQVESVVTGFTVQPPSPITLQKDAAQILVIEGGKSPYSTIVLDPAAELEVKPPVGFDNHASITLKGAATKSKYRLYIADSASHSMIIDLEPEQKPAKAATGTGGAGTPPHN